MPGISGAKVSQSADFSTPRTNLYAQAWSDYGAGHGAGLYRNPENHRYVLWSRPHCVAAPSQLRPRFECRIFLTARRSSFVQAPHFLRILYVETSAEIASPSVVSPSVVSTAAAGGRRSNVFLVRREIAPD